MLYALPTQVFLEPCILPAYTVCIIINSINDLLVFDIIINTQMIIIIEQ